MSSGASFGASTTAPSLQLWAGSVLAVAGVHVGIAAALVLHVGRPSKSTPPPVAMTLEVIELPAAPPAPPALMPGPRRAESRPAQSMPGRRDLPRFDPPPVVKAPVQAEVRIHKDEQPEEQRRISPEIRVSSSSVVEQRQPDKSFDAPDEEPLPQVPSTAEQTWEARILAQLERHKHYPFDAQRQHLEDTVYLHFSVDRRGRVLSAQIERSAGYTLLDDEVLELIQRAAPLPAPPKDVPGDPIELSVPVEFFVKKAN